MSLFITNRRGRFSLSVAICALTVGLSAGNAFAQSDGGNNPDLLESDNFVDEIVVQARKRDESIEDVPSSVSAISAGLAEQLVLEDVDDYVRQIPGAVLVASGPEYLNDIALRGQGGGRIGFSESTTGIYRDGIFVAGGGFGGRSFSKIDFFDLDAVEVYRGPQGALYGRNAVGGAVNVRTKKPQDVFTARAKVGYQTNDRYEAEAVINAPLSETGAAVRFGGYYIDQQDGFYTNADTGDVLDTEELWGLRAAVSVPLSLATNLVLTGEHSESDTPGFASLGQNLNLDAADPFQRVGLSSADRVKIDQTSFIGELKHSFDSMDLTVLANYKQRDGDRSGGDLDHFLGFNTPALDLLDRQAEEFDRFGFEARLASSSVGPVTWLVGMDYQTFTSEIFARRSGTLAGPFARSAALQSQLRTDMSTEELSSFSVFGLVGYDLTDRLEVTFEARLQSDEKDFTFERIDGGEAMVDVTIPETMFDLNSTRFLPTASISYELNDEVNLYARIATGYRPGGFNPSPTPGFFDRTAYDPEDIVSGEVGYKGVYRVGSAILRPQVAVYYSETNDVQTTTNLSATNTTFTLQNVGNNFVYGTEVELSTYIPIGNGELIANIGASTTQGEFNDGTDILFQGNLVDLGGLRVPRTRDYILNLNTVYSHPVSNEMNGFVSFGFQSEGGGYDNAINNRSSESYEMFDLSAGLRGDNWKVSVFGRNLSDELYRMVEVNNNVFLNTPRTFGISLTIER